MSEYAKNLNLRTTQVEQRRNKQNKKLNSVMIHKPEIYEEIQKGIKIPVWLIDNHLKKQNSFMIHEESTFNYLIQSIKIKFIYENGDSSKGFYFNVISYREKNKISRIIISDVSNLIQINRYQDERVVFYPSNSQRVDLNLTARILHFRMILKSNKNQVNVVASLMAASYDIFETIKFVIFLVQNTYFFQLLSLLKAFLMHLFISFIICFIKVFRIRKYQQNDQQPYLTLKQKEQILFLLYQADPQLSQIIDFYNNSTKFFQTLKNAQLI